MTALADTRPSFARLTGVELRKMVNTRAGFWLQVAIAALTLTVVTLFCIFADTEDQTLQDMIAVALTPALILLPIVGILLVSSEWSQRTALITFTLVPHRSRVITTKLAAGVVLGLIVLALCLIVAVAANAVIGGEWSLGAAMLGQIVLLVLTSMITGIAFGALFLSSAPAIVLSFVLPLAWAALGSLSFLDGRGGVAGHDAHDVADLRAHAGRHRVGPTGHLARALDAAAAADRRLADHQGGDPGYVAVR